MALVRVRRAQKPLQKRLKISTVSITSKPQKSNQTTTIFKISTELLQNVFRNLSHPRHQIAFALTCKRFAIATGNTDLKPGLVTKYGRKHYYGQEHLMSDLLRWSFIPPNLQLCKTCWKYLPRLRIWKDKQGRLLRTLRKVDWVWAVKDWMQGGRRCPTCQIPENYDDSKGWLQCWPDGFVRVTMVEHEDEE